MYTLSASVIGGNGTISPISGTYNQGTVVNLTASPASGYRVKTWQGTDNNTSKSTVNTVTMNANRTVTVEFELIPVPPAPPMYTLSGSVIGGNGTISPISGTYNQGTVVTITASPASGYRVKMWQGTDNNTSKSTVNTVTMNANRTVIVEFELMPISESTYILTINIEGQGTVDVFPQEADLRYQAETVVTLTANPKDGWEILRWEGNVDNPGKAVTTTIRMDRDQTVKAVFSQKPDTEDKKGGGGGGGCFISTSASSPLTLSGIPLIILMSMVFMGFSYMSRYPARR
jgi:hypothetical protein